MADSDSSRYGAGADRARHSTHTWDPCGRAAPAPGCPVADSPPGHHRPSGRGGPTAEQIATIAATGASAGAGASSSLGLLQDAFVEAIEDERIRLTRMDSLLACLDSWLDAHEHVLAASGLNPGVASDAVLVVRETLKDIAEKLDVVRIRRFLRAVHAPLAGASAVGPETGE
jgi:hypothetical protein